MKNPKSIICLLLIASSSFVAANVQAQQIIVDADSQKLEGINKVAVFTGNVIVTQGDMSIHADELRVKEQNGKGTEIFEASGNPAKFSRTIDGKKVTATANNIHYDLEQRMISLKGEAELSQEGSLVRGESIEYNINTQKLLAKSNKEKSKRVKTIFLSKDSEQPGEQETP